jgi:murein L,D-transpeptidase YafK
LTRITRRIALVLLASLVAAPASAEPGLSGGPADHVLVVKSERKLYLMRDGQVLKDYWIALGRDPMGHKERRGDGRTPEGFYVIDWRTEQTVFHRWLNISYPNQQDRARAAATGVDPGGKIALHGIPDGWEPTGPGKPMIDWTNGCIALTNHDLDEIWTNVADGTIIEIRP